MSDRYFFMVNDGPDPDDARPILEVATLGRPVDIWFRGETYTGEPVPVVNVPQDREYQILFDVMMIPLVSRSLADLLRDAAGEDVQMVPTTNPAYWILNVLRIHDAINRNQSRFMEIGRASCRERLNV